MAAHIRDIRTILVGNDADTISKILSKSKELRKSDDDCMVCLDNGSPYWVKLDCSHEVCSGCFVYLDMCPP
jgi:hypothetical protein